MLRLGMKKSLASVLFIGSRLVASEPVAAPVIDDCSTTPGDCVSDGSKAADGFCYNAADKSLYVINKANNCYKVAGVALTLSSVNIMKIDTGAIAENSASLTGDISANIAKYAIYNCNASKCVRAYGYLHDSAKYYEIRYDGTNVETEQAAACDGNIGKLLSSDQKLCIDGTNGNAVDWSDDNSVFSDLKEGNPFTASISNHINVKRNTNYMIEDVLTTTCVFTGVNSVSGCSTNDLGYYYLFKDGSEAYININVDTNNTSDGKLVHVTAVGTCSEVGTTAGDVGVYKSTFNGEDYYISQDHENNVTFLGQGTACTSEGTVNTKGELCVSASGDANAVPFGTNLVYYITDIKSVFAADGSDKKVVQSTANTIKVVELTASTDYLIVDTGDHSQMKVFNSDALGTTVVAYDGKHSFFCDFL
ncbi:hypothetical protein PIROE2DRAFT_57194 [Piromyces sp. E2]|nr:hypothetical protein PIROE2DRAFT_57194 [Piromyces sp. E2]|eukprot:OUM69762.1 hypothetical protein PIROE2DRAFT_57194 [Piromyces sp. E2]